VKFYHPLQVLVIRDGNKSLLIAWKKVFERHGIDTAIKHLSHLQLEVIELNLVINVYSMSITTSIRQSTILIRHKFTTQLTNSYHFYLHHYLPKTKKKHKK
jgi:hypothetical protein